VDKHACGQACQIRYVEPKIIIIKEKNTTKAKFSAITLYFTYKYQKIIMHNRASKTESRQIKGTRDRH
jgi:hypothetical protein